MKLLYCIVLYMPMPSSSFFCSVTIVNVHEISFIFFAKSWGQNACNKKIVFWKNTLLNGLLPKNLHFEHNDIFAETLNEMSKFPWHTCSANHEICRFIWDIMRHKFRNWKTGFDTCLSLSRVAITCSLIYFTAPLFLGEN